MSILPHYIFLEDFIYLFLERGEGERKWGRETSMCERYIDWLPLACPPAGDLAHNPSMGPDWESNQQPFSSQAGTQSTEPRQPEKNQCLG